MLGRECWAAESFRVLWSPDGRFVKKIVAFPKQFCYVSDGTVEVCCRFSLLRSRIKINFIFLAFFSLEKERYSMEVLSELTLLADILPS